MSCQHSRLELRGWERPDGLAEDDLWLRDEYIACLDCEAHLMHMPDDVTRIVNIPHPPRDECKHVHKHFHFAGFGSWTCLNCGKTGVSSPMTKLHFSSKPYFPIGINVSNPQADLHVIGVVERRTSTGLMQDFGDICPDSMTEDTFAEHLLRFEGKKVEITVRVLEGEE